MDSPTRPISPVQRRVLMVLKRLGEATADDLAATLEISASAVRQHLGALRSAGYVDARQQRGLPGRPADLFHTTTLTEAMFVKDSSNLSIELLSHIEEEDPETRHPRVRTPTPTTGHRCNQQARRQDTPAEGRGLDR